MFQSPTFKCLACSYLVLKDHLFSNASLHSPLCVWADGASDRDAEWDERETGCYADCLVQRVPQILRLFFHGGYSWTHNGVRFGKALMRHVHTHLCTRWVWWLLTGLYSVFIGLTSVQTHLGRSVVINISQVLIKSAFNYHTFCNVSMYFDTFWGLYTCDGGDDGNNTC